MSHPASLESWQVPLSTRRSTIGCICLRRSWVHRPLDRVAGRYALGPIERDGSGGRSRRCWVMAGRRAGAGWYTADPSEDYQGAGLF
jgi:hypothetical protein